MFVLRLNHVSKKGLGGLKYLRDFVIWVSCIYISLSFMDMSALNLNACMHWFTGLWDPAANNLFYDDSTLQLKTKSVFAYCISYWWTHMRVFEWINQFGHHALFHDKYTIAFNNKNESVSHKAHAVDMLLLEDSYRWLSGNIYGIFNKIVLEIPKWTTETAISTGTDYTN